MAANGGAASEPMPELFIGKLPPEISVPSLEARLAPFEAFNVRVLDGKGCAFASFPSFADAERAIAVLNGARLTNASEGLNVKFADQKGAARGRGRQGRPKLFVGGIATSITEDDVSEAFSVFGNLVETKVFCKNAQSPPCAFVTFSSFTEAENCINSLNNQESELSNSGKTLNVRFADTGAQLQTVIPRHGLVRNINVVGGIGTYPQQCPPCPRGPVVGGFGTYPQQGPQGSVPASASEKLFIGGLPDDATEDFVRGMMAPFGEVVEAKLHKKRGAQPCGFARFSDNEEADLALSTLSNLGRYVVKFADNKRGGGAKRSFEAAFDD